MMTAGHPDQLADAVKLGHRKFPTGVTVVAAYGPTGPVGLAVNAFSSVSLDPPTVMFCVARTAKTYASLLAVDRVCINILSEDQADVVRTFAVSGGDKFASIRWHRGETGAPVLDGSAAYFEAILEVRLPAYSHEIFLGRVVASSTEQDKRPMVYYDGSMHDIDGHLLHGVR
jgi:flavin reductase (DIM6/NTAB) family NADH-FMN oxidoreductase RutF